VRKSKKPDLLRQKIGRKHDSTVMDKPVMMACPAFGRERQTGADHLRAHYLSATVRESRFTSLITRRIETGAAFRRTVEAGVLAFFSRQSSVVSRQTKRFDNRLLMAAALMITVAAQRWTRLVITHAPPASTFAP